MKVVSAVLMMVTAWVAMAAKAVPGETLFGAGPVPCIQIKVDRALMEALRTKPREEVRAMVQVGAHRFDATGMHLKGSTGSFQPIDEKPSITLTFDVFASGQRFHGLRKIHLNNSVEDGSYMNEWLGGELFRQAGVPAARACHAVVYLNSRRLGVYVLKEGFTEDFLNVHIGSSAGQIYEPRDGHDIDAPMEVKVGEGESEVLSRLAEVVRMKDPAARWTGFSDVLDVDRFITFMAMEVILGHGDGYCIRRNNFRVYKSAAGQAVFLPHGMDNLFGLAPSRIDPRMIGLVSGAVYETSAGRRAYEGKIGLLFTNLYNPDQLIERAERQAAKLNGVMTWRERREFREEMLELKRRIRERHGALQRQFDRRQIQESRESG